VSCATTLSQFVALEAFFEAGVAGDEPPAFCAPARRDADRVERELGQRDLQAEGGFFVFLDLGELGIDSVTLADRLLAEADVVTVPGVHSARTAKVISGYRLPSPRTTSAKEFDGSPRSWRAIVACSARRRRLHAVVVVVVAVSLLAHAVLARCTRVVIIVVIVL